MHTHTHTGLPPTSAHPPPLVFVLMMRFVYTRAFVRSTRTCVSEIENKRTVEKILCFKKKKEETYRLSLVNAILVVVTVVVICRLLLLGIVVALFSAPSTSIRASVCCIS